MPPPGDPPQPPTDRRPQAPRGLAMSLVLRVPQRAVPVRRAPLRSRVELLRAVLGVRDFDLGLLCVDNEGMQRLNRAYRGDDRPTDVLSFPFHENVKAGELPRPRSRDDYNLGDIVLGVEYVFQRCRGDADYYDALTVTAAHGLCHLLGFTHSTEAEWRKMYQKEKQVLEELSRLTGTRLQPLSRGLF
ncbi:endoribonuclease YbeY isoform X3 [Canis lupus familiaris]|nr:endoribonuclease YbeY isoform X3 [Canis lupus familiaris]XP_038437628.1 endoribonuclease YbeY isoform X3 [Canis lupus familiaris]XP_038437629.1 endoribonuclease YbeY isoform X3 [Canis lupus familiaris]XP_038437630.1 endoribonuclease YbeY isoform X3 [Canis lupus familiaris]XP_038437631.1 endoribonuclease YbeY isoform X3 [Canis lupus familiaris]XP_038437632.1 endoribonuclease YbeY isoform X3 [Canis lupus familiaris]